MKHITYIFTLLTLITLASCSQRQEASSSDADSTAIDSTSLRIAVMPAISCLPVYYADRIGLDDSLGLDIELLRFSAQMDIDTALVGQHADLAFSDLIRAIRLTDHIGVRPIAACPENISMVVQKSTRVKRMKEMKEKMVAIARLSATDYWCDRILDSTQTSHDDIYRPQVNDVLLRSQMLSSNLMEAALLGEPFATWMTMLGHRRLHSSGTQSPTLLSWVAADSSRATTEKQLVFLDMVRLATERINQGLDADIVRNILIDEYKLPAAITDSLRLPALQLPTDVCEQDVNTAQQWLKGRNRLPKSFSTNRFLPTKTQP